MCALRSCSKRAGWEARRSTAVPCRDGRSGYQLYSPTRRLTSIQNLRELEEALGQDLLHCCLLQKVASLRLLDTRQSDDTRWLMVRPTTPVSVREVYVLLQAQTVQMPWGRRLRIPSSGAVCAEADLRRPSQRLLRVSAFHIDA
jgi:hypothetical protein